MSSPIIFRTTLRGDGSSLWQLVQGTGSLELNSSYFYLTFVEYFGETCLVAEQDGETIGAVIAFRPPQRDEAIFIWQIGVAKQARRQGLGKRMLRELLKFPSCRDAKFLLATITPDNEASHRLFRSFAQELDAPYQRSEFFTSDLFPEPHEAEEIISIGPLPTNQQDLQGEKNDDFTVSRKELDDDRPEQGESDENHELAAQEYASNY